MVSFLDNIRKLFVRVLLSFVMTIQCDLKLSASFTWHLVFRQWGCDFHLSCRFDPLFLRHFDSLGERYLSYFGLDRLITQDMNKAIATVLQSR